MHTVTSVPKLVALLVGLSACGVAPTAWPKYRHDLQQTGRSPFGTNAGAGVQQWKFMTGGAVRSSAAIGEGGVLYVGSEDGTLYAINSDGTQRWKASTGGPVPSSPAVRGDGMVFVGSYDGSLYAVQADGTIQWKLPLLGVIAGIHGLTKGLPIVSSPTIGAGDVVYIGSQDTDLFAVNPNGTLRWKFDAGASVESSPALATDGTIYVGAGQDLYAVNPDGTLKWQFATGDLIQSSPAVGAVGTVYVTSNDLHLYAVTPTGTMMWKYRIAANGSLTAAPALGADGTIYVVGGDGSLTAIKPDGTLRWTRAISGLGGSAPAIGSDGTLYVGSQDKHVYAVRSDGAVSWMFPTTGAVYASPSIGDKGTVYVGTSSGDVLALSSITPAAGSTFRLTTTPPAGTCGTVRSGGPGGTIRKNLSCGGINVGAGHSTLPEAAVPGGGVTELNAACTGSTCMVSSRMASQTGSNDTCSDTGCHFGPYIPLPNGNISACLRNSFTAPASGMLNSAAGTFAGTLPLTTAIYLTGNATRPCPPCVGGTVATPNSGTCDPAWLTITANPYPDAGKPCMPLDAAGATNDCAPTSATFLSTVPLNLTPVTTGTASLANAAGLFCPFQASAGAFGCRGSGSSYSTCPGGNVPPLIDHVSELGTPAGALTPGSHAMTLVSVFCVPQTGSLIVDNPVDLPGPGAVSLPVNAELIP
jgi:outer membrane protein assembly factor BamB